jgi:membrane dipeptidase
MTNSIVALTASTLLLSACNQSANTPTNETPDLAAEARRIADSSIIVDTHIDVPMHLLEKGGDVSMAIEGRNFDYPRAVAGGLNSAFMSIYTDPELEAAGGSRKLAEQLIDLVDATAKTSPDKFAIATSTDDVRKHFEAGLISLPMGMENGSPIEGDLTNIKHFYDRGIRYITLTHGLSNHISDSSYDENHQWNGLSEFGAEVVREMNRLGIMVDISHVSDDAFWQVMDIAAAPAIASHSSARHFTPGFERNMNDDMIKRLAENGGVIQITFGSSFVTSEARLYASVLSDLRDVYKAEHPDSSYDERKAAVDPGFQERYGPFPFATTADVLDHIDHVVALTSIENVGIGSDFDGVGDMLPTGLKDVSGYPNLIEGLLERGYSESDIRKILGENLLRVWSEVEAFAAQAAITSSST